MSGALGRMLLARYCLRAESYGCIVRTGVTADHTGRPLPVTMIDNPANGGWVHIVGLEPSDALEPSYVVYCDERLKITARFWSPPDG